MSSATLEDKIAAYAQAGAELDDIDRTLIQTAPRSEDEKAALWLLAWWHTDQQQRLSEPMAR